MYPHILCILFCPSVPNRGPDPPSNSVLWSDQLQRELSLADQWNYVSYASSHLVVLRSLMVNWDLKRGTLFSLKLTLDFAGSSSAWWGWWLLCEELPSPLPGPPLQGDDSLPPWWISESKNTCSGEQIMTTNKANPNFFPKYSFSNSD